MNSTRSATVFRTAVGVMFATVLSAQAAAAQKVMASNDEWFTQAGYFNAGEQLFMNNTLGFFGVGSGSNVLLYSADTYLTNAPFVSYLTALGINVTVNDAAPSFSGYAAVFAEGNPTMNASGLTSYVQGGGNVLYIGGTGAGGAAVEAAYSNPFLNAFGLNFAPVYNGLFGTQPTTSYASQGPYGNALFAGVNGVFMNSGNNLSLLAPPAGYTTQLFTDANGNGVFAVADGSAVVPEPSTWVLLGAAMLALVPVARRRRDS